MVLTFLQNANWGVGGGGWVLGWMWNFQLYWRSYYNRVWEQLLLTTFGTRSSLANVHSSAVLHWEVAPVLWVVWFCSNLFCCWRFLFVRLSCQRQKLFVCVCVYLYINIQSVYIYKPQNFKMLMRKYYSSSWKIHVWISMTLNK